MDTAWLYWHMRCSTAVLKLFHELYLLLDQDVPEAEKVYQRLGPTISVAIVLAAGHMLSWQKAMFDETPPSADRSSHDVMRASIKSPA